ncbi:MAG TPA: class I SAM-dependent methyltransferase, partial [Deinococcales bacterium]|nr:class I SAM-dependent methyltransferase [Deinococcales bacterium]
MTTAADPRLLTLQALLRDLEGLAPAWLDQAEVSLGAGGGDRVGLSVFVRHPEEFAAFAWAAALPETVLERERAMRERFTLVERRWVKLDYRAGARVGYSQYFQVDPGERYPLTTLRVFLRLQGAPDVAWVQPALESALARPGTVWGLVLKPRSGGGALARLSCSVPAPGLAELLDGVLAAGFLNEAQRQAYLQWAAYSGSAGAFLSLDPLAGAAALDLEGVRAGVVPGWDGLGIGLLAGESLPYLKLRLDERGQPREWTAYLSLARVRQQLDGRPATLEEVRDYYDHQSESILRSLGATFQAGTLKDAQDEDPWRATNHWMASRAGLRSGMRVLDAGCGAGGPALDVARLLPGLTVEGVTLSGEQAAAGARLACDAGLHDRVRLTVADYHSLPFADESFDAVLFLESAGYSPDLARALLEARRVLRPGGLLYLKDAFRLERDLSPQEAVELAEFNRTYRFRTRRLSEAVAAARAAGFEVRRAEDLSGLLDASRYN